MDPLKSFIILGISTIGILFTGARIFYLIFFIILFIPVLMEILSWVTSGFGKKK